MQQLPAPNPAVLSPLVTQVFGFGVVATELRSTGDPALLYHNEVAACGNFAEQRIHEFAAGRLCARRALAELQIIGFALEVQADRSPRWPEGISGSISHTQGFCTAAVAKTARFASLGVDAEILGRVTRELDALLFTAAELSALELLSDRERDLAATIVFSAKEAFYKCQYPLTKRWLDFTDVTIELPMGQTSAGNFTVTGPGWLQSAFGTDARVRGRYATDGELVITGIGLDGTQFH